MDKQEFNKLEVIEQINYINSEIIKGESLRNIADNLGMSKTTFRDRALKIGYVYNSNTSQYNRDNTIVIEPYKNITKELQKYDDDMKELVNYKDAIIVMLKNYKGNVKVIENQKFNINGLPEDMKQNIVNKSIKIYYPVYKTFNQLCNNYSSYKKQDLISMALYEFCNKYKKQS